LTYPTARGFGIISSTLLLLAFYLLKPDPTLLFATALFSAIIISDIAFSYAKWSEDCKCNVKFKERVWVWEKPKIKLNVRGYGIIAVEDLPFWLKNTTQYKMDETFILEATAVFPHSGHFSIESFSVLRSDPLKFFIKRERVKCNVEFDVLPEALYWLLEALAILKAEYGRYLGTGAAKTPTSSGLYRETREYIPGDPIRNIDWKASSRRRKLMVKIFEEESSGGVTIHYDLRSPTPYACDELASALLSSTLTSYRNGLEISFSNIQEEKVFKPLKPYDAIAFAVKTVLEQQILKVSEFFEYVEPLARRELEEILSKFSMPQTYKMPYQFLPQENNIVISSLLYDTSKLIEISSFLRDSGKTLNIIVPSKPWRAIGNLEEAYRIYLSYNNVKLKLEKLNAKVIPWKHLISRS